MLTAGIGVLALMAIASGNRTASGAGAVAGPVPARLSRADAERVMQRAGFADIESLRPRGAHFHAVARRADGRAAHIVIDGRTGAIIGLAFAPLRTGALP